MPFRLSTSLRSERRESFSQSAQHSAWLRPALVLLLLATQCCTAAPRPTADQMLASLGATTFRAATQKMAHLRLKDPRWTATLLVPTNAAFKNLERDHNVEYKQLTGPLLFRIINYHVISGVGLSAAGLSHTQVLKTLHGTSVAVDTKSGARAVLRGYAAAGCIMKEVRAGNVVIFLIDAVLVPNLNPVPGCPSVAALANQLGLTDFVNLAKYHGRWLQQLGSSNFVGNAFVPRNSVLSWGKALTAGQAGQIINRHVAGGTLLTDSNMLQDQPVRLLGGSTYTVDRMNKPRGMIVLRSPGKASVRVTATYQACAATVFILSGVLA